MALKTKASRFCTVFHDGSESDVVRSLSAYGVLDSMLPTDMGGTLPFDQSDWIDNRRAAELVALD